MKDNEISRCNLLCGFPFLLHAQKHSFLVLFLEKVVVNLLVLIVFHANCLSEFLALLELRFISYPCLMSLCADVWWFSWSVVRAFSGETLPASKGVCRVVIFCHEGALICNIFDRNCTCASVTVWRKEKNPWASFLVLKPVPTVIYLRKWSDDRMNFIMGMFRWIFQKPFIYGGECDSLIHRDEHSKKYPQNANT